jgi:hypothetical protein
MPLPRMMAKLRPREWWKIEFASHEGCAAIWTLLINHRWASDCTGIRRGIFFFLNQFF